MTSLKIQQQSNSHLAESNVGALRQEPTAPRLRRSSKCWPAESRGFYSLFRLRLQSAQDGFGLALKPGTCRCDDVILERGVWAKSVSHEGSPIAGAPSHPTSQSLSASDSIIARLAIGDHRDAIVPTQYAVVQQFARFTTQTYHVVPRPHELAASRHTNKVSCIRALRITMVECALKRWQRPEPHLSMKGHFCRDTFELQTFQHCRLWC